MSQYRYDDLLAAHFEKCAAGIVGQALGVVAKRLPGAVAGYNGLPIPIPGSNIGMAARAGSDLFDKANHPGRTVTSSLREKASTTSWKDVVSPLSYAAMLAGTLSHHVIDPVKHPIAAAAAHYGLEGAGLAGLLATTGHDYFAEPKEKRDWRNLADLGALAAFAGVNAHRAWSPPSDH